MRELGMNAAFSKNSINLIYNVIVKTKGKNNNRINTLENG